MVMDSRQPFPHKVVTIEEIDGNEAVVHDNIHRVFRVRTDIVRCGIEPLVGQTWIVDNTLGTWTFAALFRQWNV